MALAPRNLIAVVVSALILETGTARAAPGEAPTVGDLRKVGSVSFPISCGKPLQKDFDDAVALLHSFFYDEARRRFVALTEKAPDCAIAQWGVAMTLYHPIWTPPTPAELEQGTAAAQKSAQLAAAKATDFEKGFINAISAYYQPPQAAAPVVQGQSCHGPTGGSGDHRARALSFEKAMEKIFQKNPKQVEVAAFYALSLLGTAVPTDKSLPNQTRAAKILEPLFAQKKDHPGLAHYLIHAYDYPSTAKKGLSAARLYSDIAPWVPHVLHMPSHIFTRLGMWKEVIGSNMASATAARDYAAKHHPDATSFEELHALDYLAYGYLQTAQDEKAQALVAQVTGVRKTYPETDMISAYALGAVPARFALERRQWAEAAALTVPPSSSFAKFPFGEAHLEFAKALGAARSGKAELAKKSIDRLGALRTAITDVRFEYFAKQLGMQQLVAQGFLAQAEGKPDVALKALREAADLDELLGKHPVSPGAMYPARELLADLLLEQQRPDEALTEYEASLKLNPGRFTNLYGAARAAELAGKPALAAKRYRELLQLAQVGDGKRPEWVAAKAYLAKAGM
jgi:tetratricopeptide (TPR) repeat protein